MRQMTIASRAPRGGTPDVLHTPSIHIRVRCSFLRRPKLRVHFPFEDITMYQISGQFYL